MLIQLILFIIFILLLRSYFYNGRSPGMPPGPRPYPIVGNLVQLFMKGREAYVSLNELAKEYGDIMTVRLGSTDLVILSSYEAMRDTLGKDEWNGRIWDEYIQNRYLNQRLGIIFLEGDAWKEQRRFTIRHLRDFGFGKQESVEKLIHEELNELKSRIIQKMGDGKTTVLHMHSYFSLTVLNVLWSMVAGVRYAHDDPKLLEMIQKTDYIMKTQQIAGISSAFPILKKFFPDRTGETAQVKAYRELLDFLKTEVESHRKSDRFGSSGHFIDIFLQEIDKQDSINSDSLFTTDQLTALCLDLFVAGSETTSNTLAFAVLYMILNPRVQQRVYDEIQTIAPGPLDTISLGDKPRLPYVEAVILEIQRMGCIAPITPPHKILQDVSFRGHNIPQGTVVLLNLYSICSSKAYWKDPETFRPERFLDEHGTLVRDERLIVFGTGKRACLGDSLARTSLFLYFTTLMKTFRFQTVPGHLDPTTEPESGLTLSPKPFNVVVSLR